MQEVAQLRERELWGIIHQNAVYLLRERDTRGLAERPLSTPRRIVPHGERRVEMLDLDRDRTVQQRVDQRQPHGVRFSARSQRTHDTLHRPLRHLFIGGGPVLVSVRMQRKLTGTASMLEHLSKPVFARGFFSPPLGSSCVRRHATNRKRFKKPFAMLTVVEQ